MRKRLQELWDEVAPNSGLCTQPEVKKVRRRVDAALDGRPQAVPHRMLRLAVVAAVAVLLLTGTALAGMELIPPEFNVLSTQFHWDGNPDAIAMMNITPVSVEDDNYAMTVTSSLADGNELYFTLVIEAKNNEAEERLKDPDSSKLLSFRIPGSSSYGLSYETAPVDGVLHIDVNASWRAGEHASARLNLMDEGIWLDFPVKPVRSITLKVDAECPGVGGSSYAAGGPVTVDRVEISPLSYTLRYTADHLDTRPAPYFLFQDGSILTMSQMRVSGPSGGSDTGFFSQHPDRHKCSWQFDSIQDLSQMKAIVLGGTAYPLDGSEPYEVDVSAIPQPFVIPLGEQTPSGNWTVPLFALCDGLGADCQWDEGSGVAAASFRDITLTFTPDSKTVQIDGQGNRDMVERDVAPTYQDGELWVDFPLVWSIQLKAAMEDWDSAEFSEDGLAIFTCWVVNP